MKDCKGIFGKLFGHKFQSLLVSKTFNGKDSNGLSIKGTQSIQSFIESQYDYKYKTICTRCGEEK